MTHARLVFLAAITLLLGCDAGTRGPRWVQLSGEEWNEPAWGSGHRIGDREFVLEEDGGDLWIVTTVSASHWKREAPGLFWAHSPSHAIGRPREAEGAYRLELDGAPLDYAVSKEALEGSARSFTTLDLRLWLRLEGAEEPPGEMRFSTLANHELTVGDTRRVSGRRFSGEGVSLLGGVRRTVRVDVPPESALHFTTVTETAHYTAEERRGERVFRVFLDGAPLFEASQAPGRQGDSVQHHEVPLPRGGGRGLELAFEVEGPFGFAAVLTPRVAPAERGTYGDRPWGKGRPDLVVFLADTFRADNLRAYGSELPLTPSIDRFAEEALLFEEARSVGTHTLSTHSTMFSGHFPHQNGQVDFWNPLPGAVETVAEILGRNGYRCGAVTDGILVSSSHGLDQGFEQFDELQESLDSTRERAREFLAADDGRPVFLFVQTYAVHAPYHVSDETRASHGGTLDFSREFQELIEGMQEVEKGSNAPDLTVPGTREKIAGLEALYRGAAVDLDRAFGRFLEDLETHGPGRDGYLLFTSDHGEAFAEHDQLFHSGTTYEEQIRVPLILRGPGLTPGRIAAPASLIDFGPTLLSLAGLPRPGTWSGASLLELPAERTVFAFQSRKTAPVSTVAIIEGGRKVIGVEDVPGKSMGKLLGAFDLAGDPGEQLDLRTQATWPLEFKGDHAPLLVILMTPLVGSESASLTAEQLRALYDAGYGGASGGASGD